jgi:hypothetical protein
MLIIVYGRAQIYTYFSRLCPPTVTDWRKLLVLAGDMIFSAIIPLTQVYSRLVPPHEPLTLLLIRYRFPILAISYAPRLQHNRMKASANEFRMNF